VEISGICQIILSILYEMQEGINLWDYVPQGLTAPMAFSQFRICHKHGFTSSVQKLGFSFCKKTTARPKHNKVGGQTPQASRYQLCIVTAR
jgi:hypothetical protein